MKNLLMTAVAVLVSLTAIAQNNETLIEVQGVVPFEKEVAQYKAEINISPNAFYSYDGYKPTLDELKDEFFKIMRENGFKEDRFTENTLKANYGAGYDGSASIYTFSTSSEEEFLKLLGVKKLNGMQITNRKMTYKPLIARKDLIAAAIEDAKQQAAVVANAMGGSLGELKQVTDCNRYYQDIPDSYYPDNQKSKYYVVAKFALK